MSNVFTFHLAKIIAELMKEFDACHMFTLYRFMQLDLPPIMECMYLIFIHIQALHAMWTTSELIFPLFSPGFLTTN
jgi:hypothetical protein